MRLLVIGSSRLLENCSLPGDVEISYWQNPLSQETVSQAEAVLIAALLSKEELQLLMEAAAYRVFVCEETERQYLGDVRLKDTYQLLKKSKCLQALPERELEKWLSHLSLRYWTGEGGNKLGIDKIDVNPCICGQIDCLGNKGLVLEARYGGVLTPVLSWRMNQAANPMRRKLQIYLECQCGKGVQAQLRICCWQQGAIAGFMQTLTVPLPMEKPYELDRETGSYLSLELWAGGEGRLEVGTMHFRESRDGAGSFFPGGVRHTDAMGDEFFSYLNPMDCRPPLCVYFSGHRNQEGFEGSRMMQKMGAPFLLMSDPRLEGGAFYIGSEEYEVKLEETIREALNRLGFTSEQLILSGISMGSYGAVYYGARLMPHAILMGKPLMNAGTVAAVQRTVRPDAFGTSMDVLLKMEGRTDKVGINRLNQRMWQQFDTGDFTRTKFAVAYMQQDDYDPSAYEDLLEHLQGQQGAESCIYGKGFPGRHNDNSSGIVQWFQSQYRRILREDYGRQGLSDILGS